MASDIEKIGKRVIDELAALQKELARMNRALDRIAKDLEYEDEQLKDDLDEYIL